jgi:release factor glutamine methyltransferase
MEAGMTKPLNIVVKEIKMLLSEGGFSARVRDIKMMVQHVTGYGEEAFITKPDAPVTADQQDALFKMVDRRKAGEPVTRILGVREFWGLEFYVTPNVLDPRPDTETLVEAALKFARGHQKNQPDAARPRACAHGDKKIRILDLGTGTGCIPIALLSELPNATAVAVDVSAAALAVARRNADKNGVGDRIEFIQSDWFDNLEGREFDLIVSNPPYISDAVIPNLDVEVKNHDPILALSGGDDGLECYKKIISGLKIKLNGGNRAFLEIGFDQLESITRLVDDSNLRLCDSYCDLAGNPRVVEICSGDK